MISINPYLNFSGNCQEAFEFYRSVFGGEFSSFQRFMDAPPQGQPAGNEAEQIMHVALPISEGFVPMGSDTPPAMGQVTPGNNYSISVQTSTDEETEKILNGLSAGGKVSMPLEKTFWGARFGMCTDKFEIHWMVNQDIGQEV